MDEDAGVRAPVTRLRRRLSVEQSEESKSPAVNTPTKKRGGRRGKPELDLIDENTPDNTPNIKTKKTTSIETVEDKLTPSRRTTRIKSNTSIISDIATNVGSPRAKRAARRASQVGSDSEAPLTPLRQTRRTRKESTSSVETAETQQPPKSALAINDVIVEEPENNERKSINSLEKVDNNSPIRKSPRLANKKTNQKLIDETKEDLNITPSSKKSTSKESVDSSLSKPLEIQESNVSKTTNNDNYDRNKLSESSSDLLRNLSVGTPKPNLENLNKSTTAVERNDKKERKRTKSWTTLTVSTDSNFYSDNESTKKKIGLKGNNLTTLNKSGSGDASMTLLNKSDVSFSKQKKKDSIDDVENIESSMNNSKNELESENNNASAIVRLNSEKNNKVTELFLKEPSHSLQTLVYIEEDSDSNLDKNKQNSHENEDQCVPVVKHPVSPEKDNDNLKVENDQTKETNLFMNHSKKASIMNDTCEPMDVDETIPDNLLLDESSSKNRKSIGNSSKLQMIVSKDELNNSKRKTSISQNFEKSGNENKSTLILSQLKDTSNDVNIDTIYPAHIKNDKSFSKNTDILNVTQENEINKKNISLNCVTTSTPLQQKNLQKLALQVNSSLILANDNSKDLIEHLYHSKTTDPANEDYNKNSSDEKSSIEADRKKMKGTKKNESKISINSTKVKERQSDQDSESGNESLNIKRKVKKGKMSQKNVSVTTNESIDENESDSESQENNSLIDDEADDAGDDYESGDSQDESEREYERQNRVVDKGETLTSEEDVSNDSDYEKDSFIVSSEEEDLLDGSGDDLSMTDNELKMTAKSKEKFNERKKKEQKKASKEMYEARHKIDKKKKQPKISSSEEESMVKPRNVNKMRLDSTEEESMLELKKIKKRPKRLSESVCEQSVLEEKEMTIANESFKENDPLINEIKSEPKTPQTGNSSVAFVNSDDLNKSEATKTQTEIDPLSDSSDEGSLSSEVEGIIQKYDSVLESLNKSDKVKAKTCDISLNLEKKAKKPKATVIDELNLTQVRSSKKNERKVLKETVSSKIENQDDGSSSDSIDLRLLFSEESNDSEEVQNRNKDEIAEEQFIPLKRTDAKTDITEENDKMEENGVNFFIDTEGTHATNNKSLDTSLKNKRKTFMLSNDEIDALDSENSSQRDVSSKKMESNQDETDFPINKSLNRSTTTPVGENKKSKVETKSQECNSDSEAPLEVSYQKERRSSKIKEMEITQHVEETESPMESSLNESVSSAKKKKNKQKHDSNTLEAENPMESSLNMSKSSGKKKKNKEKNESIAIEIEEPLDSTLNMSVSSAKKQKNKKLNESVAIESENPMESSLNMTVSSAKKKKNKNLNESVAIETQNPTDSSLNMSVSNAKKKNNKVINESISIDTENPTESSLNMSVSSAKKKKNINLNESVAIETQNPMDSSLNMSVNSAKKKKNKSLNESVAIETENTLESSLNKSVNSAKKKKNKLEVETMPIETDNPLESSLNVSLSGKKKNKSINESTTTIDDNIATTSLNISASSSKKKKTSINELPNSEKLLTTSEGVRNISIDKIPGGHKKETSIRQVEENNAELSEINGSNKKKRKRNSSHNNSIVNIEDKDGDINNSKENDSVTGSQKKKLKISLQKDGNLAQEKTEEDVIVQNSGEARNKSKTLSKSNKLVEASTSAQHTKKQKRKQREDEDDDDRPKVFKENSFDKHVPRLPASILNQLDENPHKINAAKKAKVLSTTQFLVEETKKRKNKPSYYLEESICINDYRSPIKKLKKHLTKAKVLPFVPTAVTSSAGCTTNFKITVLPKDIKFAAQSTNVNDFKQEKLYLNTKIKRQGTYEMYKRNRNVKMSKF